MGVALLYLAVPRTMASWASLDARPAIEKLSDGKAPSDLELKAGVSGLQRAIAWIPSGRRLTDLALLELEQAVRLPTTDPARELRLTRAERHLVEGLVAAPMNGFAWFRLAIVRELRQAPPREVAAALVQSLDMAPNMRKLWLARASMCLAYWREFTFEELLAVRAQLRTIWTTDPAMQRALMRDAWQSGQVPVLVWVLSEAAPSELEIETLKTTVPKAAPRPAGEQR